MIRNNFSQRVQVVIRLTREEAIRLRHDYIGTEHLLLGLIREGSGIAIEILQNLDLNLDELKKTIEDAIRSNSGSSIPMGNIPFTKRAERVLRVAAAEAERFKSNVIGTEHLLLSLLRDAEGVAAQVLQSYDIYYETVREELEKVLNPVKTAISSQAKLEIPTLNKFGVDIIEQITKEKNNNTYIPTCGRNNEINYLIQALLRRTNNNPILIGEPGVGKKAIVRGFVQNIFEGHVPENLLQCHIFAINFNDLVAGATYRGQFEERIKSILNEIEKIKDIIIFIEDIDIFSKNITHFRTAISNNKFKCICTATEGQYRKFINDFYYLSNLFHVIKVNPTTTEETIAVLNTIKKQYEDHYGCQYSENSIKLSVELSELYLPNQLQPASAINLLDEAGALKSISNLADRPEELIAIESTLENLKKEKESVISNQEFEKAAILRSKEMKIFQDRDKILKEWKEEKSKKQIKINIDDIYQATAIITNISINSLKKRREIPLKNSCLDNNDFSNGLSKFEHLQIDSILHGNTINIIKGTGFVLMPHTDEFRCIFEQAIKPAMEENGIDAIKAEDIYKPGSILGQVWQSILSAEVIVADMSDKNPNVIYELGLCYGLKRCPILLVRDEEELPFNLRNLRYINYTNTIKGSAKLKSDLTKSIAQFLSAVRSSM